MASNVPRSNRIVFDDDEESSSSNAADAARSVSTNLFFGGEDSDEDDVSSSKPSFVVRPEYEGSSGQRLFEEQRAMNGATGGDERFQLDASFLPTETERSSVQDGKPMMQEKRRVLDLLQGVLGVSGKVRAPEIRSSLPDRDAAAVKCNVLTDTFSYFSRHAWDRQRIRCYDPFSAKDRDLEIVPDRGPDLGPNRGGSERRPRKRTKTDPLLRGTPATTSTSATTTATTPATTKRFLTTDKSTWGTLFATKQKTSSAIPPVMPRGKATKRSYTFNFGDELDLSTEDRGVSTSDNDDDRHDDRHDESEIEDTTTHVKSSSDDDEDDADARPDVASFGVSFWKGTENDGRESTETGSMSRRQRLTKDFKRKQKLSRQYRFGKTAKSRYKRRV